MEFTFFWPLPPSYRKAVSQDPAALQGLFRRAFGKPPELLDGRATSAVWATVSLGPSNVEGAIVYWARQDMTPPKIVPPKHQPRKPAEMGTGFKKLPPSVRTKLLQAMREQQRLPFPIVLPIFVPIHLDTTKREIIRTLQACKRVMKDYQIHVALPDRRLNRGCDYWAKRYGLKFSGWPSLPGSVIDYLAMKEKPPVKTWAAIAEDADVTLEAVRRDVKHFKTIANGKYFVVPTMRDWPKHPAQLAVPASLAERVTGASTFGDLVRLIEEITPHKTPGSSRRHT